MTALRTVSFINPQRAATIQEALKSTIQQSSDGLWFISESNKWRSQFTIPFKVCTEERVGLEFLLSFLCKVKKKVRSYHPQAYLLINPQISTHMHSYRTRFSKPGGGAHVLGHVHLFGLPLRHTPSLSKF